MVEANGERRQRLRLERFRVEGFRCLDDTEVSLEADVTVLVGRNDTGKSSLLHALGVYGQICQVGFKAVTAMPEVVHYADRPVFTADWRLGDQSLTYTHRVVCDLKQPEETLSWNGGAINWHPRQRTLDTDSASYDARSVPRYASMGSAGRVTWQTETDAPDEVVARMAVTEGFRTPTPYLFEPSQLARSTPLDMRTVLPNGAGWATLLQEVINRRDGSLGDLETALRTLFRFFHQVTVTEVPLETRHVPDMGEQYALPSGDRWIGFGSTNDDVPRSQSAPMRNVSFDVGSPDDAGTPPKRWAMAEAMSSGLLLALAYLTVAMAAPEGSLLALEEPENGLNQVITSQMMERFLALVRKRGQQLLMTTHNGFWLDYVEPRSIRVVRRDDRGSHVVADVENFERILQEDLYLSEVMNLGGPDELLEKRKGDADEQVAAGR